MNFLKNGNFQNSTVFLRADLNVPIINGAIGDNYRLEAILPTINILLHNKAVIILATHIGRPNDRETNLSTRQLVPWFKAHGYTIIFEPSLDIVQKSNYAPGTIVLLENMRFWPGEKNHDQAFAQQLKNCADYYVNDAFALLHRNDTSITDLPKLFTKDKRFLGSLIQKELEQLAALQKPAQPFVAILGGGKVADKLPLIETLLDKTQTIILVPAIVFTFMKAQGMQIGKSLVDVNAIEQVTEMIHKAKQKNVHLLMPVDFQIALDSISGPLKIVDANAIPENGIGISIGPKSLELFKKTIKEARTIFLNAAMGFAHRPETMQGLYDLLKLVAQSKAYSVIGGGDSVSAARTSGLASQFDYLSTGGGATLTYLAGEPLPGLEVFKK